MRFSVAQTWILLAFLTSLLLELLLVAVSFMKLAIYPLDLRDLAVRFLTIYSVPIGVIISGIFGKSPTANQIAPQRAFWTAFALSVIWNALILGRTLLFTFSSEDQVSSLVEYVNSVSAASSFLTVSALTYFFTSSGTKENRNE